MAVQYMVDKIKRSPNFQVPIAKIGILIINNHVPVANPVRRFKIIAIPVTPPGAREFGSRKKLTETEYNNDAKVITT